MPDAEPRSWVDDLTNVERTAFMLSTSPHAPIHDPALFAQNVNTTPTGAPAFPSADHPNNPDNPNKDKPDDPNVDPNVDNTNEDDDENTGEETVRRPTDTEPAPTDDPDWDGDENVEKNDTKKRNVKTREELDRPKHRTGKTARRTTDTSFR